MFCKKCGKEVKEGTAFCGHCGAPMNQSGGQGTLPPMNGGFGTIGSGSLAGNSSENKSSSGGSVGKNKPFVIGAAVAVLIIGLGAILLFWKFGKTDSIEGTWKWECNLGDVTVSQYGALEDELFVEDMEEMGIKASDFPNMQGVLEFDKNGKWEFHIDEKEFIKALLESMEKMVDTAVEEGYANEDEAEEAMEYIKEMEEDEEMQKELLEAMSFLEWSGDYEADTEKGEIELTVKRVFNEKYSAEVILDYEIEDNKLRLDIQEDEDGDMKLWESIEIFDQDLTRK